MTAAVTLLPPKTRRGVAAAGVGDWIGSLFNGGEAKRDEAKDELLFLLEGIERGVTATEDDADAIEAAACVLERLNPNKRALSWCVASRHSHSPDQQNE